MTQKKNLKEILDDLTSRNIFSIEEARYLSELNWRDLISCLNKELRIEAETLFYFAEGLVEDIDEGFVAANYKDDELMQRCKNLSSKLALNES